MVYYVLHFYIWTIQNKEKSDTFKSPGIMKHAINKFDILEMHIKHDEQTGLLAIAAINDSSRGPALGGTRFMHYHSMEDAINDAILLAKSMSKKLATYRIPFSGGKVVIMKSDNNVDREAFFHSYGKFINELNGKIITGCDIGVTNADMRIAANDTQYITGISTSATDHLSHFTALTIFRACEAAVKFKLHKDSLKNIRIAIQGVGKVGYSFAKMAIEHGAIVTICDSDEIKAKACADDLGVKLVHASEIYNVKCDIFAPCSIGGTLNDKTLKQLHCKIICGGANNQLANEDVGKRLFQKGTLLVPDYVANGGGAAYAAAWFLKVHDKDLEKYLIDVSYDVCMKIFNLSKQHKAPTNKVADRLAHEIISNWSDEQRKYPFTLEKEKPTMHHGKSHK